jgi:hypothetical protein
VNRNYQSLLDLVPGTTPATFDHSQFYNAASSLQTESNGQMRQANNYQIEGVDNNERARNLQVLVPPAEAIQTVDISTSNHDSELGFGGGALTNVMLKSGTNLYHGSAYEFLQNSDMNARAFFNRQSGTWPTTMLVAASEARSGRTRSSSSWTIPNRRSQRVYDNHLQPFHRQCRWHRSAALCQ